MDKTIPLTLILLTLIIPPALSETTFMEEDNPIITINNFIHPQGSTGNYPKIFQVWNETYNISQLDNKSISIPTKEPKLPIIIISIILIITLCLILKRS